jgi:hypothetical protein
MLAHTRETYYGLVRWTNEIKVVNAQSMYDVPVEQKDKRANQKTEGESHSYLRHFIVFLVLLIVLFLVRPIHIFHLPIQIFRFL